LITAFLERNRYDNSHALMTSRHSKQHDALLTNLERQGVYTPPQTQAQQNIAHILKAKVHISTTTVQPHVDIHPGHSATIQLREVEGMTEKHDYYSTPLACVYRTDGTCAGTLRPERMKYLHEHFTGERYQLPEEMIKLLKRHTQGYMETKGDPPFDEKHDWSPPTYITKTLQRTFQAYTDRITNALKCDSDMTKWYTNSLEDQKFGAHHTSYSQPWIGSSVATPLYSPEEMHKAIRWAYHSAVGTEEPTLTTLLLSSEESDSTSYMKWLRQYPLQCHLFTTIPGKDFHINGHDYWQGPCDPPNLLQHGINVILVGNLAGYKTFAPKSDQEWSNLSNELHQGKTSAHLIPELKTMQHEQTLPHHTINMQHAEIAPIMLQCPKALQLMLHTYKTNPENFTNPLRKNKQSYSQPCTQIYTQTKPLRYDWRTMAYTDGSKADTKSKALGSGLFLPDKTKNIYAPHGGTYIAIDPEGKGITNTIVRAELVPILHALRIGRNAIATDSLCSIQLINMIIASPGRLTSQPHHLLLKSIQDALIAHPQDIYLFKVKSHGRVIGNIKADKIAKEARLSYDTQDNNRVSIPDGNSPHDNMYWPHAIHINPDTGNREKREFSSLHTPLKKHMHEHHHLGNSNTQSLYYQWWAAILPMVNKLATNHFMTHVTDLRKKIILNYRFGTLLTNKWKHRMDPKHTDKCPLCGLTDGGHHALSGCKVIAQTTGSLRHNAAGRSIIKAISVGSKGANLIMADVGRKALMDEANIGGLPHRIPEWILDGSIDSLQPPSDDEDDTLSTAETNCNTSPDNTDSEDAVEDPRVAELKEDIDKASTSVANRLIPDGLLLSNGYKSNMTTNTEFTIILL
jgi:ribonuclease HI